MSEMHPVSDAPAAHQVPVPTAETAPPPVEYDANKRPEEIEEDIARTRAELSETLDALERKLAPRQLLEKGVDMLRDSMDGNFGRMGETLRSNPIPLALIAGGLGWFLLSRTGGTQVVGDMARSTARRVGDLASDAANRAKDAMGGGETLADPTSDTYAYARPKPSQGFTAPVGRTVAAAAGTVSDVAGRARETIGAVSDRASAYADAVGENVGRARSRFSQLMDEHPLAVGVFGFLAGAALAVALPSTRLGDATLGPIRDRLVDETKERGRDVAERVRQAAEAVADSVQEEGQKSEAKTAEVNDGGAKDSEGKDELKPMTQAGGPGTVPGGAPSSS